MKTKIRESNYELLRIVSIFFIVLGHIINHSNLLNMTYGTSNFILRIIFFFIIIHVNCFMLITGYYQSKSTFKLKRLINLTLQIAFYNLLINSILKITGLVNYSNSEFLTQTLFYNFNSYWYIQCYFIIYLVSPFFNRLIDHLDKIQFKKLIIVLVCCFSIFPFLTGGLLYKLDGYSIVHYITLYFIGAYIRKYNLNKNLFKKKNIYQKRMIYTIIIIGCFIFNTSLFYLQHFMYGLDSNVLKKIASIIYDFRLNYSNPIIIVQSLAMFLYFGTFQFKNKFINKISSLTLGIYIIHESFYIRSNLYHWICVDTGSIIYGRSILIKIFLWAVVIFIVCAIIEFLRQLLFQFLSKRKIIYKINLKIMNIFSHILEVK